jgi:hypothetical protein
MIELVLALSRHSCRQSSAADLLNPSWRAALASVALLCTLSLSASAARQVNIRLEGEIVPECAIAGTGGSAATLDLDDLSRAGSKDYRFLLSCNSPFSYHLEAQSGALTNKAAVAAEGSPATLPYEIAIHIPTDGKPIDDRCTADSLRAGRVRCPFSHSSNAIALDAESWLTVEWNAATIRTAAGIYTDQLTLSVGIRQ